MIEGLNLHYLYLYSCQCEIIKQISENVFNGNLGKLNFIFEGLPSPSRRALKTADGGLQRSQTIGQRIMGNMMDNLFLRNLTSKSKGPASDASMPSSPVQVSYL